MKHPDPCNVPDHRVAARDAVLASWVERADDALERGRPIDLMWVVGILWRTDRRIIHFGDFSELGQRAERALQPFRRDGQLLPDFQAELTGQLAALAGRACRELDENWVRYRALIKGRVAGHTEAVEVEEAVKVARLVDLIDDVALVSLAATRALPQIDRQAGHDLVDHAATIGESLAPASEWIQAIRDTVDERYLTSMPALQLRQFHLAMSGPAGERNADRVFYLNSAWLQCCLARMRMVERELSGVRSELADSVEVSRWEDLDSPEVLARIGTEHGQVGKLVAHIRSRPLLAAAAVRGSDKPWSMEFHARTGMQALLQIEPGSPMLSMFFYGSDGEGAPAEVEGEVARWCGVEARVSSGRAEFDSAAVRGAVSPRDALHGAATMIVSGHSFTLVKSS